MQRITRRDLDHKAAYLNRLTGGAQYVEGAGHYYIYQAYGGSSLRRTALSGGGSEDVLGVGFVPVRYLYDCINGYIKGLELGLKTKGALK